MIIRLRLWMKGYHLRRLGNRFAVVDSVGYIVAGGSSPSVAFERWKRRG